MPKRHLRMYWTSDQIQQLNTGEATTAE
jgi:hypothetical protein